MDTNSAANDIVLLDTGPTIGADDLSAKLGWTLQEEGLCQGDVCVMVPEPAALRDGDRVDVTAVAALLDRPSAVDETSGLVAIGVPRDRRRSALNDLKAPDFTLDDIDGSPVKLSDHRSKKRLLVAFSSW